MTEQLKPSRPYLLRAMHEWMTDNSQTPLVLISAETEGVSVPQEFVKDGQIVLNIAWSATQNLQLGNEWLEFDARFAGTPRRISVPLSAVQAIYARESGQGMSFAAEPELPPEEPAAKPAPTPSRPGLKIVK